MLFAIGKIYFAEGLHVNVLQIIKESRDCIDIAKDLEAIQNTIHNRPDNDAVRLDGYLRKKYPIIDIMLDIADSIQAHPSSGNSNATSQSPYKAMLEQDHCGTLCHTAIKKGVKPDLKSCIDHVEA